MKKLLVLISVMIMTLSSVYGLFITVDDFNHPDGLINTSDTNNLGYNYGVGCEYVNNTIYCDTENGNINRFDYIDETTMSFNVKMLYNGSFHVDPDYYLQQGLTLYFDSSTNKLVYYPGNIIIADIDNEWHTISLHLSNSLQQVGITLDGNFLGNYSFYSGANFLAGLEPVYRIYYIGYFDNITIWDCLPSWSCNGYATCNTSDESSCNSVIDTNSCNSSYSGDYSEFSPQSCDYCTYDLDLNSYGVCNTNISIRQNNYTDLNFATCCNITKNLITDCPFGAVQETGIINESCTSQYQSDYTSSDIQKVAIDGIIKFLIGIVSLTGIIGLVFIFRWVKIKVMKK